ncbi:hypothetical protein Acr_07g0017940 [Actinidia rufa]|uniref:Uncharacterized protein n=1 Tax=Actinidia rufa TaxID=165716 RepID=A0A7J0EYV4_9ERIC|nr:hypothetical protein Acr_07g0017940 [Actinidia rufa]
MTQTQMQQWKKKRVTKKKRAKNADLNVQESKGAKKESLGSGIEEMKNVDSKEEDDVKDANEVEEENVLIEEAKTDSIAAEEEKGSVEESKTETENGL